jgi:predicted ferric reductase
MIPAAPLLAAAGGRELWYLTRSTGMVALLLLTATVVLGIAAAGDWARPRWPRFVTQGLHRNLSLLAVVFVFVHVLTTVVDGYVAIGWMNAVVPFTSPYHRFWVGLGAVAFDMVLALVATSLLRPHLRPGTWRGVHWLAYGAWPVALVHGLGVGTDVATELMRWITAASVTAVGTAVAWRVSRRWPWRLLARILAVLSFGLLSADAAATDAFASMSHSAASSHRAPPLAPPPYAAQPREPREVER